MVAPLKFTKRKFALNRVVTEIEFWRSNLSGHKRNRTSHAQNVMTNVELNGIEHGPH